MAAFAAIGSAQAQSYLNVNFNGTQNIAGDTPAFRGSFTYNGVVYGPSSAVASADGSVTAPTVNSLNLATFDEDTLVSTDENGVKLGNTGTYKYSDGTRGNAVVYRFYRQQYSGIAGNLTKGANNEQEERKHFVKAIVGQGTDYDDLPSSGNYIYEGIAFSNFPTGDFTYTVNLASKTGSGSFTLDNILVPAAWVGESGAAKRLDVGGTLNTASLVADANGIVGSAGVEGGSVTAGAQNPGDASQVALWNAIVSNSTTTVDPKYYLNLFGTSSGTDVAREVAGTIIGLPERIGGVAIIGTR
ncbi:hypothetical protein D8I35_01960 [Corticibacter populi]|uniref:Factor H binding protein-like C-terminal domain-containing protein n=2 Tax=Corticibacter populi TaxID=1550736 RepID=A0A3M6QYF3_9BURK|nr:hypothetical protein D8I35_01960 [Corticibacter populi]